MMHSKFKEGQLKALYVRLHCYLLTEISISYCQNIYMLFLITGMKYSADENVLTSKWRCILFIFTLSYILKDDSHCNKMTWSMCWCFILSVHDSSFSSMGAEFSILIGIAAVSKTHTKKDTLEWNSWQRVPDHSMIFTLVNSIVAVLWIGQLKFAL